MFQIKLWGVLAVICMWFAHVNADPALKDTFGKTKSGGRRGFYGSRFGSVYNADDFKPEHSSTTAPELLRDGQLPTGVAEPHQQNVNDEIKAEVPNIEETDDYRLGVKGGIKGGIKRPFASLSTPRSLQPDDLTAITTFAPIILPTESPIRVTIEPNGVTATTVSENLIRKTKKGAKGGRKGFQYDINRAKELFSDNLVTEVPKETPTAVPTETPTAVPTELPTPVRVTIEPNGVAVTTVRENLVKGTKMGSKGGRNGFQYDVQKIKDLFPDNLVTELPVEVTTVDVFRPQILNLPTEKVRGDGLALATEAYNVQQTEIPVQQTAIPVQQTEVPVQQTEQPFQQTEEPVQQTELPVQQTEEPLRETEPTTQRIYPTTLIPTTTDLYEPIQDTQSPVEPQITVGPDTPVHTTYPPTTTEYPDVPVKTTYILPTTTGFPDDQQTELPQVTVQPEEPVYTTQQPTTTAPDDFQKYPLGMEGSHQLAGSGGGKGKGSKSSKVSRKSFKRPRVDVSSRGAAGVNSRRPRLDVDPAVPLLPSLLIPG